MKKKQQPIGPTSLSAGEIRQMFKAEKEAQKRRDAHEKETGTKSWSSRRFLFLTPCLRAEIESATRSHPMPQLKAISWAMGAPYEYESDAAFRRRCVRWLVRLGKKKPPRFTPPPPPKIKPLPHADNSAKNGKWMNPGDINPLDFPPSQE